MKLKVEQVTPAHPYPVATVSRMEGEQEIPEGAVLRCGGYRFKVHKVLGVPNSPQIGLMLETENGVRPGMVLRPALAPIADDELASMCARMTHIMQCLTELDASNVADRLMLEAGDDKAVEWLHSQGVLDTALSAFVLAQEIKVKLGGLETQRKFGDAASKLNSQLSVIQLADGEKSSIGS
jgi:hypothetical protein